MMNPEASPVLSRSKTLALGSMAAFLVIIIILFPDAAFQSSLQGLSIWWNLVFPALLPFLILTELLIGFGVVQAAGTLLEPLMRHLFRLPGVGGWALASGLIVGFPIGAKITASLREKGLLSRQEAQRLVNISHLCSPLFLITVVGVGFLHQARLGILLAVVHYLAAILTGFTISRKKHAEQAESNASSTADPTHMYMKRERSLWKRSLHTMHEAYLHDGRAFGKLLGDAVMASVQALMLIGGYIIIYSVIIHVLTMIQLSTVLQQFTAEGLEVLHLSPDLIPPLLSGAFEIHLGAYSLAKMQDLSLLWQMALLSALFGWGGLSAHAQVGGFIHSTDIRYLPFLLSRCLKASIAFILTFVLWNPLQMLISNAQPGFSQFPIMSSNTERISDFISAWHYWQLMFMGWILVIGLMLLFSLTLWRFQKQT